MPRLSSAYQAVLRSAVDSVRLNSVSWGAEALYRRLLSVSDGGGGFHGEAALVACKAAARRLGRSTDVEEIEGFLRELEEVGLIVRWSVGTERFLRILGYFDGGNRQKAAYPEPPEEVMAGCPPAGDGHPPLGAKMHPDRGSGIGDQGSESGDTRAREGVLRTSGGGARARLDTLETTAGHPPWVLEVLREYAEFAEDPATKPSPPATVKSWQVNAQMLVEAGEKRSREALREVFAQGWTIRGALKALRDEAQRGRSKADLEAEQEREVRRKRDAEEQERAWREKFGDLEERNA